MTAIETQKRAYIEVHVLGGWEDGESIVLRLPDGSYGVIDSFVYKDSYGEEQHPVVDFLVSKEVKDLRFLCITHPHEDHVRGILKLFEMFSPREVWYPSILAGPTLRQVLKLIRVPLLEAQVHAPRDAAEELHDFYAAVNARRKSRRAVDRKFQLRTATMDTLLYSNATKTTRASFEISSVAPHGNDESSLMDKIADAFEDRKYMKDLEQPQWKFNGISLALMISCPGFRILLGGDVENASWEKIHRDSHTKNWCVRLYKVSHHGSKGAFCPTLKDAVFCSDVDTESVVTGYKCSRLPNDETLTELQSASKRLGITHRIHLGRWQIAAGDESREAIANFFHVPVKPVSESREALNRILSQKPQTEMRVSGRCSYEFDRNGNLLKSDAVEPATWIEIKS